MDLMSLVKMTCSILHFTLFRFVEYIGARIRVTREASWRVWDRGKIVCHGFNKFNICIREGKFPDDKKNSGLSTKFFANFHYFCILFPSSCQNSTKPQHFTMRHYSAKQHSGIIYYILQQSHVMHKLVILNLVVIHIIIVVTHENIDGQPGLQYIITSGLAYGSGQPFSLAHSTT
jgi:hypothetical protein